MNLKNIKGKKNHRKQLNKLEQTEKESFNEYLCKLNWFSYLNKKNHESKILSELEYKYGKDAIMIVGDWSGKGRLKYISTPGIGFKRLLSKKFKVYTLNEYKTSQICSKTLEKTSNLVVPIKEKLTKLHSVQTYQMLNNRLGCINRDKNAIHNYKTIVHSLLENGKRPLAFAKNSSNQRSTKNPIVNSKMAQKGKNNLKGTNREQQKNSKVINQPLKEKKSNIKRKNEIKVPKIETIIIKKRNSVNGKIQQKVVNIVN